VLLACRGAGIIGDFPIGDSGGSIPDFTLRCRCC
jgi:hypothetical protein